MQSSNKENVQEIASTVEQKYQNMVWWNLDHPCVRAVKKGHMSPTRCQNQRCSDCPFPKAVNDQYMNMMEARENRIKREDICERFAKKRISKGVVE